MKETKEMKELRAKIDQKQKEIAPLQDTLHELNLARKVDEHSKFIGLCYIRKHRSGDKSWDAYTKVLSVTPDASIWMLTAEKDKWGEISIVKHKSGWVHYTGECKKITEKVFNNAMKKLLEEAQRG